MDRRLCWLALCWWFGGCQVDDEPGYSPVPQQTLQTEQSVPAGHHTLYPGAAAGGWPSKQRPSQETQQYVSRWDKVDVKRMMSNERLLRMYVNCLVSRGPCTPDGREIKRALPEALKNACAKCTKSQIESGVKIVHYLREFEPEKFETLAKKYDPQGIYRKKYLGIASVDNNSLSEQTNENQRRRRLIKRHAPRFR